MFVFGIQLHSTLEKIVVVESYQRIFENSIFFCVNVVSYRVSVTLHQERNLERRKRGVHGGGWGGDVGSPSLVFV